MRVASGQTIKDQTLQYVGGSATKVGGKFVRLSDFVLQDLVVDPGAPLKDGGDPQFTSVVNGRVTRCTFRNFLDAHYEDPVANPVNHHIENLQIGGCQGFLIEDSAFPGGEIHALFARAWPTTPYVPSQTIQGLKCVNDFFGKTRHGFNCVHVTDDLADPSLGATSAEFLGCTFQQSLVLTMSKGTGRVRGCHFPYITQFVLKQWAALGYDVGDNIYGAIDTGKSPFAGDKVDPKVDLTKAPGAVSPPAPAPAPTPPPAPTPVPVPPAPTVDVAGARSDILAALKKLGG